MRLTLRTLLAYLDDILEPTQAKEIGKKITESSFASALVSRIREVMRRRRLTAPAVDGAGAGLDPNTVSEYLDNTLPADSVADVEKICLDSDIHLAEVAACHQILTLVLGEPVDIVPHSRERMYALGPVGQGTSVISASETEIPPDVAAQTPAENQPAADIETPVSPKSAEPFSATIPEYLRPRPFYRRALPYVVAAVIAGAWLGLIVLDPTIFPKLTGPQAQTIAERNGSVEKEPPEGPSRPVPNQPAEEVVQVNRVAQPDQNIPPEPSPQPVDSTKPVVDDKPPAGLQRPENPQKETAKTVEAKPPLAAVDAAPVKVKPAEKVEPGEQVKVPKPAAQPARVPMVHYNSRSGILLRFDVQENDWFVMPRRAIVHVGERLAVPEPFDATLDVENGTCRVTLLGGTALRLMGATQAAPFGFELDRGRVVLGATLRGNRVDKDNRGAVVGIAVRGELWRVELMTTETRCGVEIVPREPDQFEQEFGTTSYTGSLYVATGSVRFADGTGRVRVVDSNTLIPLAPDDRAAAADEENALPKPSTSPVPRWLDEHAKRPSTADRRYANLFEKEFDDDETISLTVPALVKDPKRRKSEWAVKCLALCGSYVPLVKALAQSEHEEALRAAIVGLRVWLPQAKEHRDKLKDELGQRFHADDVEVVYRLLWGYNEKDARNRVKSNQLVEWLQHDHVAIRELAFYQIVRLTGRKYDYRSFAPAAQRQAAVARWLGHLAREGALLAE